MTRMACRGFVVAMVIGLALAPRADATTVLTREFRYEPDRVSLSRNAGITEVQVVGGTPERRPGYPDLPALMERVEIPADMRVARIEVARLETETMGEDVNIAPAIQVTRGLGPELRTARDPAFYERDGYRPDVPVTLGYQGFERERHIVTLQVTPLRWSPTSGRLERVTRLVVRLVLEPSERRPLALERIVPDWEDSRPPARGGSVARTVSLEAAPAARAARPFKATQLPSLLGSPVAYVIVTSDALAASFQPLADWKTQSGVPAEVRTLSFIREQYPTAADDPERIRMFIRDAYTRWGTQWVLLGGDTELIPPRRAHLTVFGDENIPSDLYYSCLDGNWNADGDSVYAEGYFNDDDPGDDADLLPEVWVGRAPVVTPADAQRFVQKTLTYEKTPVSDYMENFLFFAQVITPSHWNPPQPVQFDGASLVEQDLLPILDTTPWIHSARLYQNYTNVAWRPGALPETRAIVLDSLEVGYNVAVHVGHGFREVMSCGDDNLTNNDMHELTNGNRLMNFYAIDCTSSAIDFASIGEALMRAPSGGAVTNIGSTSLDFPAIGRVFQKEFFRVLLQDSVTAIGRAQAMQKVPFVGASFFDGFFRLSQLNLLLLGDPELRVFTARPRELTVTAPGDMPASDSSITVQVAISGEPLYGARVTAWMPGHEYRSALTDGAGEVTLPFHPDALGPVTLTVTAFNARPWQGSFAVVASTPAALQAEAPIVLDDGLGGRHGNGDGIANAGEVVDVMLPVRNAGGTTAPGVIGILNTSDAMVTITAPSAGYGPIDPGTTATPIAGYRISIPFDCPDQREVPFTLDLVDDDQNHTQLTCRLLVRAPELVQVSHSESEENGDDDGRPEPGETVTYSFRIRNLGTGGASGLFGRVRSYDGLSTVLDSTFTVPDLPAGAEATSTPVRFTPTSADARLSLEIENADGPRLAQPLDLGYPVEVTALTAVGGPGLVRLIWGHGAGPDLAGYNVYRATSAPGPFVKVTQTPAGRTSTVEDGGLVALTRYYYQLTAVDSSGNESGPTGSVTATTNPALHAGFPAYTRESSSTPVAVAHVYTGLPSEILVGGEALHLFHADGTAPVDADGSAATPGDFTTQGKFYTGGGSIADLDGNGSREIIGAAWTSQQLQVFDSQGVPRPGFPVHVDDPMWSSVAVGNLDGVGPKEMVFATLGRAIYAFRSDGTEWIDGDANPSTVGVFKMMGTSFNPGTPALADLLGNGQQDIVYGGADGFLYAWKPDGSNLPGFPVNVGAAMSASVAVGKLDGPAGPLSIVVPASNNTIRVYFANGSVHAGFPLFAPTNGNNRTPSPALADMNGDGMLDIVYAGTTGQIYVFDRNGTLIAPWGSARFSALTSGATEASPVVADIDGDGLNDVVIGDENGSLAALSGATGAMLPGFPIQLAAEASGSAALCDCDDDGKSEIVVADFGGTVHVWDYDFPFSPAGPPPWPQYHHDAERTGFADTPAPVDVDPPAASVPRVLELALRGPNPARTTLEIAFGVPLEQDGAPLEVTVFDLAGRLMRTLARGPARPGRASLTWDMRDARGALASRGLYLVRLRAGTQALTRKVVVLR